MHTIRHFPRDLALHEKLAAYEKVMKNKYQEKAIDKQVEVGSFRQAARIGIHKKGQLPKHMEQQD